MPTYNSLELLKKDENKTQAYCFSITSASCKHQKLHNKKRTLLIAISKVREAAGFSVENAVSSLQFLEPGHKQLFLRQCHAGTKVKKEHILLENEESNFILFKISIKHNFFNHKYCERGEK